MPDNQGKIYLSIDYGDTYIQPLLLAALHSRLPPDLLIFLTHSSPPPPSDSRFLQWRQYEDLDFERLLGNPKTCLANSYIIRKALIRKHFLSTTVAHWLVKNPGSVLRRHVKGCVKFEVDFAEFLDEALVEAFELRESWERNERLGADGERDWWILKPGMSERGAGIRLFSSEEELTAIFEEWDPPSDDEDDEARDDEDEAAHSGNEDNVVAFKLKTSRPHDESTAKGNGIITSQLRHFVAQPYIHPPLLLPPPHPPAGRKFHIRTYVLAVGALKVYVYKPMLALFAAEPYQAPLTTNSGDLGRHLTNTCLQSGEREGSVHAFWSLPSTLPFLPRPSSSEPEQEWRESVFTQILTTTSALFEAAARTTSTHFQPLPNCFEIFGLDFLVDGEGTAWLLEVNAFPDFAQTGEELRGLVQGLIEGVVDVGVRPFFGLGKGESGDMVEVLDIDLGRR
ncbi:hypothetical protein B0A55_11652 [Friedmanniomyces simplex]|uniref:ATP-grasp domain-containing protein n=1 Tax=Friedmanniomyces simplex TaxID=329884 RepID=A0A4U0WQ08_9PEZI|nr:hypothetical protein B0A55_11652 [Friedmanniomyces simplex]